MALRSKEEVESRGDRRATVSASLIDVTRRQGCRCEDEEHMAKLAPHVRAHLRPGMTVEALGDLAAGCTTGMWTCGRLDALRRRYGI